MKKQAMNKRESDALRTRIVTLIDEHQPGPFWRQFLEELQCDVEARLQCLDEEEGEEP